MIGIAAGAFVLAALVAIGFQMALALGAPWGEYAMGGRFPGRFPPAMRAAAIVQGLVIAVLALIVATRGGLVASPLDAPWLIWIAVAFSVASLVVNALSRSPGERRVWVPVALVLSATSLVVALA